MSLGTKIGRRGARGRWLAVVIGALLVPCWVLAASAAVAAGVPAAAPVAAADLPRQELPAPVLDGLRAALEAYEGVRGALAADRLDEVPAGALRLATSLRLALAEGAGLAEPLPAVIEQAVLGAESMAGAADLAAARVDFGEVSRSLMLLATGDPRLTEGWHVFSCPMVDTFGKWMQPGEKLENPYMGPAMLACGSATDWSVPASSSAERAEALARTAPTGPAQAPTGPEPVLKPGIPGLRMVDVRDHKFLWRELDELQSWESGNRISIAEFRGKAIEKTAHFLELEGSASRQFTEAASGAIASLRESFRAGRLAEAASGTGGSFASDLDAAITRVSALLDEEPRHQLFAPELKKWLLKLTFGPREAKESEEAREAGDTTRARVRGEGQR